MADEEAKRIPGGRLWLAKVRVSDGALEWHSEDGNYRILTPRRNFTLISFIHRDGDCGFLQRSFPTIEAAMEYAEKM